ncbi:MAG: OB-fold nucleic acid binding domain-containing protein [Candidatus Aenigmatarchaeota archaeon]
MERKRLTAMKAGLAELSSGKWVKKGGFESSYVLTSLGRRLSRVRVMGLIVDKWASEDGNYATLSLDDGNETARCKIFVNTKMFDGLASGDLVDVVGKLREWQGEIYVAPETVRKMTANWETLRMLELKAAYRAQKALIAKVREMQKHTSDVNEIKSLATKTGFDTDAVLAILEAQEMNIVEQEKAVQASSEVRDKVLKLVIQLDRGEGADYGDLLKQAGLPEQQLDDAVTELLESGVCFEPKAGKIKKL